MSTCDPHFVSPLPLIAHFLTLPDGSAREIAFKHLHTQLAILFKPYLMLQAGHYRENMNNKTYNELAEILYQKFIRLIFLFLQRRDEVATQKIYKNIKELITNIHNKPYQKYHDIRILQQLDFLIPNAHTLQKHLILANTSEEDYLISAERLNESLAKHHSDLLISAFDINPETNHALIEQYNPIISINEYFEEQTLDIQYDTRGFCQKYAINFIKKSIISAKDALHRHHLPCYLPELVQILDQTIELRMPTMNTWLGLANIAARSSDVELKSLTQSVLSYPILRDDTLFSYSLSNSPHNELSPLLQKIFNSVKNARGDLEENKKNNNSKNIDNMKDEWRARRHWRQYCIAAQTLTLNSKYHWPLSEIKTRLGMSDQECTEMIATIKTQTKINN